MLMLSPQTALPSFRKMMIFIDAENLVFRFQEMRKIYKICDHNYNSNVNHEEDVYIWWLSMVPCIGMHEVIRCTMYSYVQGDSEKIHQLERQIKLLSFNKHGNSTLPNNITPCLFKKVRGTKAKGVDISICVDALSHGFKNHYDTAVILSGDGDYIKLIKEIQSMGKQCYIGSFSHGCNPELKILPDYYFSLDDLFFLEKKL